LLSYAISYIEFNYLANIRRAFGSAGPLMLRNMALTDASSGPGALFLLKNPAFEFITEKFEVRIRTEEFYV
jgi:hypothetical protein